MAIHFSTRPVGPDDLADLARLFEGERNTRRCWCMASCSTRTQFAAGWFRGGNRRRFEALAGAASTPMGILASAEGEPVGWAACGPRSRYVVASKAPSTDETEWLLPCLFVETGHRGQGLTRLLVSAAVEEARREGAVAIEGRPLAASVQSSADAFVGREQVFEDLGFRCVARPSPERVLMRLDLRAD